MIKLSKQDTLRAAINAANRALVRPQENGSFTGPSVEIAERLSEKMGVELQFVVYRSAAEIYTSCDRDEWDIAFLAAEPSRRDRLAFSKPYLTIDATLLTKAERPEKSLIDFDLLGVKIGATRGAAYHQVLANSLRAAEVVAFDTPSESIRCFLDEGLDAVAGIRESLSAEARSMPGLRLLAACFASIEQCVAVPVHRARELPWIDEAIGS